MAVGCIGMSIDDFDRCTLFEMEVIIESWRQCREAEIHAGWEQARFSALHAIMPYSKRKLKLTDVARFPWEEARERKERKASEVSTRERYEEIVKLWGK